MLHVLWLILKIVGIVLLAVIGILLLLLFTALFVPVRYRGKLSYYGKPEGFVRVSWLLHILSFRLQYEERLTAVVRIFGYPVLRKTLLNEEEAEGGDEEEAGTERNAGTEEPKFESPKFEKSQESKVSEEPAAGTNLESEPESGDAVQTTADLNESPGDKEKRGIRSRITRLIKKLQFSFQHFCDKLKGIKGKKEQFLKFWNDAENKNTFTLLMKQCKRLLKHILPRKVKGRVAFGFDDPYMTGQTLMYISPFLGWYYKHLTIEPHFERKILEGEVEFKGRIRAKTVLFLGLKVYRDRNFRKLLKKWWQ